MILQIILEILRNLHYQMRPIHAVNVVVVAWIHEIIHEFAVVDGLLEETQAVLPYHCRVG